MEHQYFLLESIPELERCEAHTPLICGPLDEFYCRQVKQGLLERVGHLVSGCATFFTVGEYRVHGFEG